MKRTYQRCVRCVMDTTDSQITFDENTPVDFCSRYRMVSKRCGRKHRKKL